MPNIVIDVPTPSMGATVSELTILNIAVAPGDRVAKGQKLAELESDKSAFDFEAPGDGLIVAVHGAKGAVMHSGQPLFRMETAEDSLRHLQIAAPPDGSAAAAGSSPPVVAQLVWTPRALKLAKEAGLDPATLAGIEATGPGGRVSGDDVTRYLTARR